MDLWWWYASPSHQNLSIDIDLTVNNLIDSRARSWNLNKLNDLFYPMDVARITVMKPVVQKDDFWI